MEVNRLRRGKVTVVLDTNMLLVPFQFGVDIIEEIYRLLPEAEIVTIPQVIKELERLKNEGNLKERLGAKVAEQILKNIKIIQVNEQTPTDTALVSLAEKGAVIATNDKLLKKRIWKAGGRVIFLREKNHLEML